MYWNENSQHVRRIPVQVVEDHDTRAPSTQRSSAVIESATPTLAANGELAVPPAEESDWQSLALLLRADMDNFRKRQSRRADDAVVAERERLLRLILPVADNLARALSYDVQGDGTLRRGVELTQRELMRLLEAEGVTRIETVGQPFTPELHEAVAAVAADVKAGTVVKEVESGYQLGERLLRPARVVVAA